MAVKRKYRLNLRNYGNLPAIMLSQYDEGYALEFEIRDGTDAASDLSAYTVTLKGTRADTLAYSFAGTVSTNVLTFVIDTTMTACAGRGTAEIAIKDTANDVLFATFNMPVFVERAAVPEGSIDADVERAQEIAEEVEELIDGATEGAEAWAVGQRGGVDVESTDETYHNNAKYYAEQAADSAASIGIDATLTQAGKAADAKKTGDEIDALKEDLNNKANADGYYADLVSGGSTQLLSDMVATDTTPYNYRTAGGSLEIGDREKLKKIVGGSLAVNQLVRNGDFSNGSDRWSLYMATAAFDNNIATVVTDDTVNVNSSGSLIQTGITVFANHKYIVSATIKGDGEHRTALRADGGFSFNAIVNVSNDFKTFDGIAVGVSDPSSGRVVITAYGPSMTILVKNVKLFDLTAMFGTTIADYVYSLETATAGAGVAWLKAHFPKIFDSGYIPYNEGTLEHVSGLSAHKMTGFNQWDEEWEVGSIDASGNNDPDPSRIRSKNYTAVLPNTNYYFNAPYTLGIRWYAEDKSFISGTSISASSTNKVMESPSNACYLRFSVVGTTTYNHDICINLHWDGERDGEYEHYEEHSYPLDSDVTLRGIPKLDANNNLYYDGDVYESDGKVTRKYGIVDLGTLNWTRNQSSVSGNYYYVGPAISDMKKQGDNYSMWNNMIISCGYSNVVSATIALGTASDKTYGGYDLGTIRIKNDSYTDATTFKSAMSGVYLVYELATPTTESADPYTEIQNVSNWGTEEFVTTSLVPVGHETAYQPDLRAKIEVAPESPNTDGLYLMKRENGQNSYVAYLGELPSDPTTDGTYTLKCTVASGTATKTWEADE